MSIEKDELVPVAHSGQDALANTASYASDKADIEHALDSFEFSKYKDASIDTAKWKTLRDNPETAICENVNITPSAFNFFKGACDTSIAKSQLTEVIQQSWSVCEGFDLMREGAVNGRDYLYFPLVALIPDDGHSFCEVSIGINREGGLPYFCGRILIPEEWHKNGFSLSNIEEVSPRRSSVSASKQQADTQLKRLTNTREDKKRVEGILREHLERGMWYHLPDVGQTLKRFGGYDSKGILRGFLANCDYLEMSEPDPKSGQPNVRIKIDAPEVIPGTNDDPSRPGEKVRPKQITDSDEDIELVSTLIRDFVSSGSLRYDAAYSVQAVNALIADKGYTVKGYSNAIWSKNAIWRFVEEESGGGGQGSIVLSKNSIYRLLEIGEISDSSQGTIFNETVAHRIGVRLLETQDDGRLESVNFNKWPELEGGCDFDKLTVLPGVIDEILWRFGLHDRAHAVEVIRKSWEFAQENQLLRVFDSGEEEIINLPILAGSCLARPATITIKRHHDDDGKSVKQLAATYAFFPLRQPGIRHVSITAFQDALDEIRSSDQYRVPIDIVTLNEMHLPDEIRFDIDRFFPGGRALLKKVFSSINKQELNLLVNYSWRLAKANGVLRTYEDKLLFPICIVDTQGHYVEVQLRHGDSGLWYPSFANQVGYFDVRHIDINSRIFKIALYDELVGANRSDGKFSKEEIIAASAKLDLGFDKAVDLDMNFAEFADECGFLERIEGDPSFGLNEVVSSQKPDFMSPEEQSWIHGLLFDVFASEPFNSIDLSLLFLPPHKKHVYDYREKRVSPGEICEYLNQEELLISLESEQLPGSLYKVAKPPSATTYQPPAASVCNAESARKYLDSNVVCGALRVQSIKYWKGAYKAACLLAGLDTDDKYSNLASWIINHLSFPDNEDALLLGFTDDDANALRHIIPLAGPRKRALPELLDYVDGIPQIALPLTMVGVFSYWAHRTPQQCLQKMLHCALRLGDVSRVVELLRDHMRVLEGTDSDDQALINPLLLTGRNMLKAGFVSDTYEYFTTLCQVWPQSESMASWKEFVALLIGDSRNQDEGSYNNALRFAAEQPEIIDIMLSVPDRGAIAGALSSICADPLCQRQFLENAILCKIPWTEMQHMQILYGRDYLEYQDDVYLHAYILLQYAYGVADQAVDNDVAGAITDASSHNDSDTDTSSVCSEWIELRRLADEQPAAFVKRSLDSNRIAFAKSLIAARDETDQFGETARDLELLSAFIESVADAISASDNSADRNQAKIARAFIDASIIVHSSYQSIRHGQQRSPVFSKLVQISTKLFELFPEALKHANDVEGFDDFARAVAEVSINEFRANCGTIELCRFYCYILAFSHIERSKTALALMYWERRFSIKNDVALNAARRELKVWDPGSAFVGAAKECGGRTAFLEFLDDINTDFIGLNKRVIVKSDEDGRWKLPNDRNTAVFSFIQTKDPFFANKLGSLAFEDRAQRDRPLTLLARSLGFGEWQLGNMCHGIRDLMIDERGLNDERIEGSLTFLVAFLADFLEDAYLPAVNACVKSNNPNCQASAQSFFPLVEQCFERCKSNRLYSPKEPRQSAEFYRLVGQLDRLKNERCYDERGRSSLASSLRLMILTCFPYLDSAETLEPLVVNMGQSDLAEMIILLLDIINERGEGPNEDIDLIKKVNILIRLLRQMGGALAEWLEECVASLNSDESACSIDLIKMGLGKPALRGDQPDSIINRYLEKTGNTHSAVFLALKYYRAFCRVDRSHDRRLFYIISHNAKSLDDFDAGVLDFIAEASESSAATAAQLQLQCDMEDTAQIARALTGSQHEQLLGEAAQEVVRQVGSLQDDDLSVDVYRGLLFRNWGPIVDYVSDAEPAIAAELGKLLNAVFHLRPHQFSKVALKRFKFSENAAYSAFLQSLDESGELLYLAKCLDDATKSGNDIVVDAINRILGIKKTKAGGSNSSVSALIAALNQCDVQHVSFTTTHPFDLDEYGNATWHADEGVAQVALERLVAYLGKICIPELTIIEYFASASVYKLSWIAKKLDKGFMSRQAATFMSAICWIYGENDAVSNPDNLPEIVNGLEEEANALPAAFSSSATVLAESLRNGRIPRLERNQVGRFVRFADAGASDDALTTSLDFAKRVVASHSDVAEMPLGGVTECMTMISQGSADDEKMGHYVWHALANCDSLDEPSRIGLVLIAYFIGSRDIGDRANSGYLPAEALMQLIELLESMAVRNVSPEATMEAFERFDCGQLITDTLMPLFIDCAYGYLTWLIEGHAHYAGSVETVERDWEEYIDNLISLTSAIQAIGLSTEGRSGNAIEDLKSICLKEYVDAILDLTNGDLCRGAESLLVLKDKLLTSYDSSLLLAKCIANEVQKIRHASTSDVNVVIENEDYNGTVYLYLENMNNSVKARIDVQSVTVVSSEYNRGANVERTIDVQPEGLEACEICVDDAIAQLAGTIEISVRLSDGANRYWNVVSVIERPLVTDEKLSRNDKSNKTAYYEESSFEHGLEGITFAGREKEADALWAEIESAYTKKKTIDVVLYGPKGVGKTTLALWLAQAESARRDGYVFVPVEIRRFTCQELVGKSLLGLRRKLNLKDEVAISDAIKVISEHDFKFSQLGFMDEAVFEDLADWAKRRGERVVFLIDESQQWLSVEEYDEFMAMRTLLPDSYRFLFIGTGRLLDIMDPQIGAPTDGIGEHFKMCSALQLHHFRVAERYDVISQMMGNEKVLGSAGSFTPAAIEYLARYTGGHARSCVTLGNTILLQRDNWNTPIYAADVRNVAFTTAGKAPLVNDFWGEFGDNEAVKEVVRAFCMGICLDGKQDMSIEDVQMYLETYPLTDYSTTLDECNKAIGALLARDYLIEGRDPLRYTFASLLFRDYVEFVYSREAGDRMRGSRRTKDQASKEEQLQREVAELNGYTRGLKEGVELGHKAQPSIVTINVEQMNIVAEQFNLLGGTVNQLLHGEISPDSQEVKGLLETLPWPGDNRFLPASVDVIDCDEDEVIARADSNYANYVIEGCCKAKDPVFGKDRAEFGEWLNLNTAVLESVGINWSTNALFAGVLEEDGLHDDEMLQTCKTVAVAALLHSFLSQVGYDNYSPVAALLGQEIEHIWKGRLISALQDNPITSLMLVTRKGESGVRLIGESNFDRAEIGSLCQLAVRFASSYYHSSFPEIACGESDAIYPASYSAEEYGGAPEYQPYEYGNRQYPRITNMDLFAAAIADAEQGVSETYEELARFFSGMCCVRSLRNHASHGGRYSRSKFSEGFSRQLFSILVANEVDDRDDLQVTKVLFSKTHTTKKGLVFPNSLYGELRSGSSHMEEYDEMELAGAQILRRTYELADVLRMRE